MVGLPVGFCIDSTEVTRAQYAAWLAKNPSTAGQISDCSWNSTFTPSASCLDPTNPFQCQSDCDNHPQICVDWCDAYAYCKAVGKRLCGKIGGGTNDIRDFGRALRSQWYAACTSNGVHAYPYGDSLIGAACNTYDAYLYNTVPAGSLTTCQSSVNGYAGVYDLSGNVDEWEDSCDGAGQTASCLIRGGMYGMTDGTCAGYQPVRRDFVSGGDGIRCCSP